MQELLYTSAPKGLKPGSRGFCTVLSTAGMPAPVATTLEGLSAYRPVFPPGDPQASLNPVVSSHLLLSLVGQRRHVLSRIADHGLDYSQRTNKLAHHVVLEREDRPAAGPGWFLGSSGLMRSDWDGVPRVVQSESAITSEAVPPKVCQAWKNATGDAGWGGVLAEAFLADPNRLVYIIFEPGTQLLPLMEESIALLPPEKRWDVTFSTYFTKLPKGATCQWRCVLAGSPEANESRRHVNALRIDLSKGPGVAAGGAYVTAARTGKLPQVSEPVPTLAATKVPEGNISDNAPPAIKIAQDKSPPPKPIPPSRRRQNREQNPRKSNIGLWGAVFAISILLIGGIAILLLNPPENVPQKDSVAKNEKTSNVDTAEELTPPAEDISENGVAAVSEDSQGESATNASRPDNETKTEESLMEKEGSTKEEPSQEKVQKDIAKNDEEKAIEEVPQVHPSVTYWRPDVAKLEYKESYSIGSVPFKPAGDSIKVLIPYDLREFYKFEGNLLEKKNRSTLVQEDDKFKDFLSITVESNSKSTEAGLFPISITPHQVVKVEDLNRFVVEVTHPDGIGHSYLFLHRREKNAIPQPNKMIAAMGISAEFDESDSSQSAELPQRFKIAEVQFLLDDVLIELSGKEFLYKPAKVSPKRIELPIQFSSKLIVSKKLPDSLLLSEYQDNETDLQVQIAILPKESVKDEIAISSSDQPAVNVQVSQLQVLLLPTKNISVEKMEFEIIEAAKRYHKKKSTILSDSVTKKVMENKSTTLMKFDPMSVYSLTEYNNRITNNLGFWSKLNGTLNETNDLEEVKVIINVLSDIETFIANSSDLMNSVKNSPNLKLKGIVIMQKCATDKDNEWSMPLVISDAELLQKSEGTK